MIDVAEVLAAHGRIRDRVQRTPCARSEMLSRLSGFEAYLKLENHQLTGSFKERGALNRLLALGPEERGRGLIAASAGNHAQGVAYHAGRLGLAATIVMPETTPIIKVASTRAHGARVVLYGSGYDDAYAEARRLEGQEGLTFVHPFDDPWVIAGQGTIGLELVDQVEELDAVVVPVGGGGLVTGIGLAVKAARPTARVIGVQTEQLAGMRAALEAGRPVTLEPAQTLADGIAVKRVGDLTLELARRVVDEVVTVSEEEIASAILYLLEREKTVAEGAGAVAVAALMHHRLAGLSGRRVAAVVSGGNIDVNLVARIIERGLVKDGRLVRIAVALLDKPGQLARVSAIVAELRANVIEVHHARAFASRLGDTTLQLTLETRGPEHVQEILQALRERGYAVEQLGG
jgi:threonine dehydratase